MKLQRDTQNATCTLGKLSDGFDCETLEPPHPMPAGTYPVALRYSPSHGYAVPGFSNVPGHSNIEIHPGNTAADTLDCVLPGDSRGENAVQNSRATFARLMTALGVPNFKALTSWDAVRDFTLANPDACRFNLEVVDVPSVVA
jgi:Family of unknown function (DUF5675)